MVATLRSAGDAGSQQAGSPSAIQKLLTDQSIEVPFPVYVLQELTKHLTYAEIRALRFVSKGYFVWVYKSVPMILELDASNCLIGSRFISSLPLSEFSSLKYLNLSHNFIDTRSFAPLKRLNFLRFLNLSHNTLRLPADGSLAELTQVKSLNISGNFLRLQHLDQLQKLTQLEHLELAELQVLTSFPIEKLSGLTNLTTLNLSKNFLNPKAVKFIASLPKLQNLDLSFSVISSRHHLQKITTLEQLNLSATSLGFDTFCLSQLRRLRVLDVSYNCLDDTQLRDLAIPASLGEQNVAATGITLASFREFRRLTNLRSIYLHDNGITEFAKQRFSIANDVEIRPIPRPYKRKLPSLF